MLPDKLKSFLRIGAASSLQQETKPHTMAKDVHKLVSRWPKFLFLYKDFKVSKLGPKTIWLPSSWAPNVQVSGETGLNSLGSNVKFRFLQRSSEAQQWVQVTKKIQHSQSLFEPMSPFSLCFHCCWGGGVPSDSV